MNIGYTGSIGWKATYVSRMKRKYTKLIGKTFVIIKPEGPSAPSRPDVIKIIRPHGQNRYEIAIQPHMGVGELFEGPKSSPFKLTRYNIKRYYRV